MCYVENIFFKKSYRLGLFLILGLFFANNVCAKGESVSSKTFKELTEIQTIMGEGQTDQAYTRLKSLLTAVKPDTLDKALTLQTLGYVEMAKEDFPNAIKHLKEALSLNRLPQNVVYNIGYLVAQLHAALGQFDEALDFAADWFKQLESPSASQMIFMANIYAQNKRFKDSIPYARDAISTADKPQESWYQLLTGNYFELKQYKNAARTLESMIDLWPSKRTYWEQLASVYVVLEEEKNALAVLKIAFSEKILDKEASVKSLVQLSFSRGIPEHAARLLERAMSEDLLPQNETYLEMLAVAYNNAKERDKAIDAYERLALKVDSGDPWVSISNIYVEKGQWPEAESALKNALSKNLKTPGNAWLLLGISQTEQNKFSAGKKSLKKAGAYKKTEKSALKWIKYADDMKRQVDWLAQHKEEAL